MAEAEEERPSLVIVESHIAYGAPTKQDTASAHGSPLGEEEIRAAKLFYGWDPDKKFYVPPEVSQFAQDIVARGRRQNEKWDELFSRYNQEFPGLARELELIAKRELPGGWDQDIPAFEAGTKISGRSAGGKVLNAIAARIPFMIGGSADLTPSTLTDIKGAESFGKTNRAGRNLHFGIRENAMGAVANGIALSGLRTYASTFLVFSDYARPSIRLSAIMKLPVLYVFTHDSIGVGEDGPTHQPIEHLASLRAMPDLEVLRPADANEVAVLWRYIMETRHAPIALVLSRQDLPVFDRTRYAPAEGALKGGYILADCTGIPDLILIATGSEVQLVLEAYESLKKEGIRVRVVSLPAWKLFERQSPEYRESVLPSGVAARLAVEAGSPLGWSRFTGKPGEGEVIGMTTFGASGKIAALMEEYGFTADAVIKAAKSILNRS
jgi:transketolase